MEKQATFCQSCAMPLTKAEDFGTNADGGQNEDYCGYCYKDGDFTSHGTMEEMVEQCIPFALEAGVYPTAEVARQAMLGYFPQLMRWKK